MSKLYYNIYNYINDHQFSKIEKKLRTVEFRMSQILLSNGWKLNYPISITDGLNINFDKKDKLFLGNLGVSYDDKPEKVTFTFYVTKYYDEGDRRFGLTLNLIDGEEFGIFQDKIVDLTQTAMRNYDNWTAKDISTNGWTEDLN